MDTNVRTSSAPVFWKLKKWIVLGLLTVIACIVLFPLVWMTMTSFKPVNALFSLPPNLWESQGMGFQNYVRAIVEYKTQLGLLNSVALTTLQIVVLLLVTALAAYPLATMRFPGRNAIFYGILATMMIPQFGMLVPAFKVIATLKLINNYAGIVLPTAASAFGVFLLRQYYTRLPRDFFDAGIVDGANQFTLWFKVALPLAKPALAALAIYTFTASWKALLWPMLILQNRALATLPMRLFFMVKDYDLDYASMLAASTIAAFVPLMVFLFFQSQFIEGLSGGVKG